MLSSTRREFGTLEKVLEVPEEDLFDGLIVKTAQGIRFVDADKVREVTTRYIACDLDDAATEDLPEPEGSPTYEADPLQDEGGGIMARIGRVMGRAHWKKDGS